MRIIQKPKHLKESGALCQFCLHGGRCIAESSLGEKRCAVFAPMSTAKEYNIEIYECTPKQGLLILKDLVTVIEKANTVLLMATVHNVQHLVLYMIEVRDRLMERARYLNDLLPKVQNRETFTLRSKIGSGNWKENYKVVMRKLDEYRTPEELVEIREQLEKEQEAVSCSNETDSSDGSSSQPVPPHSSTASGKAGKSAGTVMEMVKKMIAEKNNAGP